MGLLEEPDQVAKDVIEYRFRNLNLKPFVRYSLHSLKLITPCFRL